MWVVGEGLVVVLAQVGDVEGDAMGAGNVQPESVAG